MTRQNEPAGEAPAGSGSEALGSNSIPRNSQHRSGRQAKILRLPAPAVRSVGSIRVFELPDEGGWRVEFMDFYRGVGGWEDFDSRHEALIWAGAEAAYRRLDLWAPLAPGRWEGAA